MSLNPEARQTSAINKESELFQSKWLQYLSSVLPEHDTARLITAAPGTKYDIEIEKHKVLHSSFQAIVTTKSPDFAMRPTDNYAIFMKKVGGRPLIAKGRVSTDGELDDFLLIRLDEGAHLPPIEFGKPWKVNNPGGVSIETSYPVKSILVRDKPRQTSGNLTYHMIDTPIPFDNYARLLGALMQASKTNQTLRYPTEKLVVYLRTSGHPISHNTSPF
jgi:hypothetical protein